jgi:hypothetical protein
MRMLCITSPNDKVFIRKHGNLSFAASWSAATAAVL